MAWAPRRHRALPQPRGPDTRESAAGRGYDRRWRRLRAMWLRRHPLCQACADEGRVTPAELVHHVVAIEDGGARLDQANLESLCRRHHEAKHRRAKHEHGR